MNIKSKKWFLGLLLPLIIIGGFLFLLNKTQVQLLQFSEKEIKYKGNVIETKQSLPRLFIQSPFQLNINAKYSYSILKDLQSNQEFIRIDKKIIQTGTAWFDNVTSFYIFDSKLGKYRRVLVSSEEQNKARFPQTSVVNPNTLTIKFYYDVSRPNSCYGYDCLSFWTDFYQWDSKKQEFKLINQNYKSFYQELLKKYEEMDKKGCSLEDVENKGLITFEDVYKSNDTNHCKGSSRMELNKFFEVKGELQEIIR